ncbi:uncharacterized protein LOC123292752 [Chrysoperla carnea]|uniref:uncharacterized protein LOC123292752 n=1 Tax=Chrysoperla carnea TaxID=189513 RepID=UPI001D067A74|nr:uncharacterized protein LOC123292752 [Chrysoperla carnea]
MSRLNPDKFRYTDFLPGISAKFTINTLSEILTKATDRPDIKLKGWQVGGENKKGDSYLSTLFKINIVGVLQKDEENRDKKENEIEIHVPVLIKSLPSNIGRRKTYRSTDFFRNEVVFYNQVWPTLLNFQLQKNVKDPFMDIPLCYSALADGENDFIALEDLTPQGYGAAKRQTGLDFDHCLLIIRLLARFHSLSFAYKDQHPELFHEMVSNFEETYFREGLRSWYEKCFNICTGVWLDALEKEVPGSIYQQKFQELVDNDFLGQLFNIVSKKNSISCVCQGDAWVPNFLIKYNNESSLPESVKIIDFQIARVSSPSLDLSIFFYACTKQSVRENHWDDLIDEYHKVFTESLIELGTDPKLFPKDALLQDFIENAKFGLGMVIETLPLCLTEDSETVDLDAIQGTEAIDISTVYCVKPIQKQENRKRLVNVVKHVVDNNFI